MATTVAVKPVSGPNFGKGVKYARQMGGMFDSTAKVWYVPANRPELGAIGAYGLTWATPRAGCGRYTVDQGCPMHGEYCAVQS